MNLSIEVLSQPISEALPCGENLEYDSRFLEMEGFSVDKPISAVQGEGEKADWSRVEKIAGELREQTRDLRVQVLATIAAIHMRSLPEFRDNLRLLKTYLVNFWDSVHPQLDPDDNNDLTRRLTTLQMLDSHGYVTLALNRVTLVRLKGMGQFCLRDVDLAQGRESAINGEAVQDINLIRQVFLRSNPEDLATLRTAVSEAAALLTEMVQVWAEKAGKNEGLSFANTIRSLQRISSVLQEFAPTSADGESPKVATAEAESANIGRVVQSGVINSRADVVRVLDRICEYYSANEPSSPIPLLLRRAQRLVEKSFLEILEDMVPDGVAQARIVSGNLPDK